MRLAELARVIRSKNAGPTLLTVDVLFADEAGFKRGVQALSVQVVADAYARPCGDVQVLPIPAAHAVKIVLPRRITAGAPGDRDVYGAQQHGPLLGLDV